MSEPHAEPLTGKEEVADEALELIKTRCEELGLTLEHAFVTFHVGSKDDDGENATTAYHGEGENAEEAAVDLFAFLLTQAKGVGKKLGLTLIVGHVHGGPRS